jgi:hypothetical protein
MHFALAVPLVSACQQPSHGYQRKSTDALREDVDLDGADAMGTVIIDDGNARNVV